MLVHHSLLSRIGKEVSSIASYQNMKVCQKEAVLSYNPIAVSDFRVSVLQPVFQVPVF